MGMDLLDIVFRLERRFDIKITREELFQAFPGADKREFQARRLLDLVMSKLPGEIEDQFSPSSQLPDKQITDAAEHWLQAQFPLKGPDDSVPRFTRRIWRDFELQGIRPPPLGYGRWRAAFSLLQLAGGLGTLAVCAILAWSVSNYLDDWGFAERLSFWAYMLFFVVPFLVLIVAMYLGMEWLMGTQPAAATMSGLAKDLAQQNVRTFARMAGVKLRQEQVWQVIRRVLSEVLAIEEEKILPESDLVRDLLMD